MTSVYFSVGPKPGQRSVTSSYGVTYVSQSEVALQGKVRVIADADPFYGDDSKPYRGRVLTNPTWRAIKGQAQRMLDRTKDYHYFLEGVQVAGQDGDVQLVRLVMGS